MTIKFPTKECVSKLTSKNRLIHTFSMSFQVYCHKLLISNKE
jgi:hypothetical protein